MTQYEEVDAESYAQGWRKTVQEAADAAMANVEVPIGEERELVIYGRKKNPFHEYRAAV
ncbi:MAG TPA: hypothetical protein VFM83_11035 [Gaiellaceae bacterium]|nr:hypothetical protein [Gaiellaceae bacterium]